MIKSLKLTNFRQFKNKRFDFEDGLIVITGRNTKGKSSILEAIYYLTNGQSPWSDNVDLYNEDLDYFRIDAEIEIDGYTNLYSVYRDKMKRMYQIDKKTTTPRRFFRQLSSTLFSPEQIEILLISPSKRREFLDDFCSKIDTDYDEINNKYKKILRHRNAYVKKLSKQFYETGIVPEIDKQLMYWSEELAKASVQLILKRLKYIDLLNNGDFKVVYKSTLDIDELEDLLTENELYKLHLEKYKAGAKRDIALGYTNIGAHRDDWSIMDGKDIKRFGSRGEKRLAIIKLIYFTHSTFAKTKGFYPFLMLDDIPSELDDENIIKIFNEEILNKQQTFITAIRREEIPENILLKSQVIELD
ncbi:MAG: replication and repair protein RecF protein [candidate division WS6 bacterium GW2011_GWF2_39_15]|uniref:DNA replication and repair protein RecF n=1 Tax=candidate division WS6 bacterium GW2011_GWF2_39_15 TaxID=1619100 RepID=A0A0G0QVD1_9BACT|nr:MAG: replication and repair protein RecF protein [candidate division WS6 bacterium GW2011_GWF2_39_15]